MDTIRIASTTSIVWTTGHAINDSSRIVVQTINPLAAQCMQQCRAAQRPVCSGVHVTPNLGRLGNLESLEVPEHSGAQWYRFGHLE